jgi:hypothetical protein
MLRIKIILGISCALMAYINCQAQLIPNLVKNPSFEEFYKCPDVFLWRGNIHYAKYWHNTRFENPQYYNSCAIPPVNCQTCGYLGIPYGICYQYAHTGSGMSGILLWAYSLPFKNLVNTRNYITGELKTRLTIDSVYCFEMYCNRVYNKDTKSQTHSIGALFTISLFFDTSNYYSSYDTIGKTPQVSNTTTLIEDTLGWTKIAQEFIATDTFRYLTIGNFEPDATTWFTVFDTSEWINGSFVYIDDVAVYKGKCREEDKPQKTFFNLYPNPGSGVFSLNYGVAQDAHLVVYDILGRTVLNETLAADKVLHHFIMQQYSNGMYFLKVFGANDDELYSQKFLLQR